MITFFSILEHTTLCSPKATSSHLTLSSVYLFVDNWKVDFQCQNKLDRVCEREDISNVLRVFLWRPPVTGRLYMRQGLHTWSCYIHVFRFASTLDYLSWNHVKDNLFFPIQKAHNMRSSFDNDKQRPLVCSLPIGRRMSRHAYDSGNAHAPTVLKLNCSKHIFSRVHC